MIAARQGQPAGVPLKSLVCAGTITSRSLVRPGEPGKLGTAVDYVPRPVDSPVGSGVRRLHARSMHETHAEGLHDHLEP
jgi:hypothetical protein